MSKRAHLVAGLLIGACALPAAARAAGTETFTVTGTVGAKVIAPSRIQPLRDLRFGHFLSPAGAGTVIVRPDNTISTTGGMNGADAVPQPSEGRGPAEFLLDGTKARFFIVHLPNKMTLTGPAGSMEARSFTDNIRPGRNFFDANGHFTLEVGATLNVGASQPQGHYSGTFDVTVLYL